MTARARQRQAPAVIAILPSRTSRITGTAITALGACAAAYLYVEAEHRMQAGTRTRRGTTKPWHSFVSKGKQILLGGSSECCKRDLGVYYSRVRRAQG